MVIYNATLCVDAIPIYQWKMGRTKNDINIKTKDNDVPNTMNLLPAINPKIKKTIAITGQINIDNANTMRESHPSAKTNE